VCVDETGHVDVCQRVAVDDEKSGAGEERERTSWAAGGTEDRHFPRVTDAHAFRGAVADDPRDGVRQVMKVQHGVVDAVSRKPMQDSLNNGAIANGKRRLGANIRKRTEAGSQTRSQHECRDHSSLKTMFVPVSPNSSRCLMNRAR